MNNYRLYGEGPYSVVVVHGGPGMPGSAAPIARELSKVTGILEVLETTDSVTGQVAELAEVIRQHAEFPVILVGHSWGAVLSYLTAAQYPALVRKLILISTPALEIKERPEYTPIWMERLSEEDRVKLTKLQSAVWNGSDTEKSEPMGALFRLMAKADSYAHMPGKDETLEYQHSINSSVGSEFHKLLRTKELVNAAEEIECPVVAIHGDYDLRPADAVVGVLSNRVKDFKLILLEKCGHYPWMERYAGDNFFDVLKKEIE